MSLKAFHLFFIVLSTVLAFGFAAWSGYQFAVGSGGMYAILGGLSLAGGVVLVIYERHIRRMLNDFRTW